MTLEDLRIKLLRLAELDAQQKTFRSQFLGQGNAREAFNQLKSEIEAAAPGWELQHMSNSRASTWVLLPIKEERNASTH